jgi:hypothetical protein
MMCGEARRSLAPLTTALRNNPLTHPLASQLVRAATWLPQRPPSTEVTAELSRRQECRDVERRILCGNDAADEDGAAGTACGMNVLLSAVRNRCGSCAVLCWAASAISAPEL